MKSDNQGAPGGSEVLTSWVILCTALHIHPKSQEEQRDPPRSPTESKQLIPSTPEAKNLPKQKTRPGRSDYT